MSAAYDQTVRYENAVDALPVAFCEAPKTLVALVFTEEKAPPPTFHCKSTAPLLARPPFVPVHVAACEAIVKFHGRLDLTVADGPASSWNPASNAASTGFVRVVEAEFSVSLMTLGTLTDAVLFTEQLLPVHDCAAACVVIVAASSTAAASEKPLYVIACRLLRSPEHSMSGDLPCRLSGCRPAPSHPPKEQPPCPNRRAPRRVSKSLTLCQAERHANVGE